jgi:hypothetical protein
LVASSRIIVRAQAIRSIPTPSCAAEPCLR